MTVSKRVIVPAVVALVVLAAGGWWLWHGETAATDEITLYGNIDLRKVSLAFEESGRIASMKAREGARVAAGDVLARLDTERLQQALERSQAQVDAQRQRLAALEAGSRPEEIRQARATLSAAQAEARNAEREYHRKKTLRAKGVASQAQLDMALTARDAANARRDAAAQALTLALKGPREQDIAAARAQLKALQAELAIARKNLTDARLVAPSAGVIETRVLEPGDMASPQRPVYTLALDNPVWVRAYVPETDLGRVKPGMRAWIRTDSFPDKRYPGWVGYVSPSAEFTPKSVETTDVRTSLVYQVRVFACNPDGELRLGMPATVTLRLTGDNDSPADQPPAAVDCTAGK
ncbi:MAG: efflux RND transporter periplasmic adaptor subunit [Gammaproteobacteria bacterium]|jgi:HlyD family secretion protein